MRLPPSVKIRSTATFETADRKAILQPFRVTPYVLDPKRHESWIRNCPIDGISATRRTNRLLLCRHPIPSPCLHRRPGTRRAPHPPGQSYRRRYRQSRCRCRRPAGAAAAWGFRRWPWRGHEQGTLRTNLIRGGRAEVKYERRVHALSRIQYQSNQSNPACPRNTHPTLALHFNSSSNGAMWFPAAKSCVWGEKVGRSTTAFAYCSTFEYQK